MTDDSKYLHNAEERKKLFDEYARMTPAERAERAKEIKQRLGAETHDQMMNLMKAWNKAGSADGPGEGKQLFPVIENEVLATFLQFTYDRFQDDPHHNEIAGNQEDFYMNCFLCGMYVMYEYMAEIILKMEE